jgi:phenylalanyl-tRNA synthetase beta chain
LKILVSWLRDFVPITVSVKQLADGLTMRGFEVSAIDPAPVIPERPRNSEDAVLDLEITTNRPDCLSVIGIAREVSTLFGTELQIPALPAASSTSSADSLSVTVEDHAQDLCARYTASTGNVRVEPSPDWLSARLRAADVRPVNNVVDVTNYVLLELGHPMHAFDRDQLKGDEIRIRQARAGEIVKTLDDEDRALTDQMLVIADQVNAQAVAGIMGSAASEVTASTKRVTLESAYFTPRSIRRTSKELGLSTEASYRFERGADIEAPLGAMLRAQQLLIEIGACSSWSTIVDHYPAKHIQPSVSLRHARIKRVLGIDVEPSFVIKTLTQLGFNLATASQPDAPLEWNVTVPTHRVDVGREIDLIEEIARHYGYDRLPSTFPVLLSPPNPKSNYITQQQTVRHALTASGCSEAITYGFIEEIAGTAFLPEGEDPVRVANPLSEKYDILRPSLLPGLVDSLIYNRRREHHDIRLFEIGHRFTANAGETAGVALVLTGSSRLEHWSNTERKTDLYDLIGIIDTLCDALGIVVTYAADTQPAFVPGQTSRISATSPAKPNKSVTLGYLGQLDQAFCRKRGLPAAGDDLYAAELDLGVAAAVATDRRRMIAQPLPRHPSVLRDIAIIIDAALPAATVRGTIRQAGPATLLSIREFDRYEGENVAAGCISLAFRLTFRASDRTLTDTEVQQSMDSIVEALQTTHDAVLR